MKIMVTGSRGMLGRHVCEEVVKKGHTVLPTDGSTDISKFIAVENAISKGQPNVIINCAGKRFGSRSEMILANALGPHILSSFGIPMVHMSTDCVFSGDNKTINSVENNPDPTSLYGKSKLVGEVDAPHVTNVRGSFIGVDHGFLRWILDSHGVIEVWKRAYWNGTDVRTMAEHLVDIAINRDTYPRKLHASSIESMAKAEMAKYIVESLELDVSLKYVDEPFINRVLDPNIELEPVKEMLERILRV